MQESSRFDKIFQSSEKKFPNPDIWLKAFLQADNIEKKEIRNIWSLCAQLSLFRPLSPQSPILLSYLLGTKLKKLQQYQNWKNRSRNSEIRKPWNCVECSLSNINWAMTHRYRGKFFTTATFCICVSLSILFSSDFSLKKVCEASGLHKLRDVLIS